MHSIPVNIHPRGIGGWGCNMKHRWQLDEDGDIDAFAVNCGYHNGPVCERCGKRFCEHCTPECYDSECEAEEDDIDLSNVIKDGAI